MNADEISAPARAALDGSMPFPEIVGRLIANDVENHHVDFATGSFTFYGVQAAAGLSPLPVFDRK